LRGAPRGSLRYFNRGANRRNEFSKLSDFLLGQRRVCRCGKHAQNFSAPRARSEVAFPLFSFRLAEAPFRICRKDLALRAIACVARIHLVEGFAQAPGESFIAPPHFELISTL
jgi:hypothetical protein